MKKQCELCRQRPASMYCDSDQASLCFQCDGNVHAANFLVARHTRTLLCHACYAPTPWTAAGDKLGSAVSFCHRCSAAGAKVDDQSVERNGGEIVDYEEDEYEEDDDEEEEEEEEEDGDNQVVPWSAVLPAGPSSSSNSEDDSCRHSSGDEVKKSAKRSRETVAAGDDEQHLISPSLRSNSIADGDETTSIDLSRHKRAFLYQPKMRTFSSGHNLVFSGDR